MKIYTAAFRQILAKHASFRVTIMPEIEFVGNQVLIPIPKALLVLTKEEFLRALTRGKAYRRAQALKARLEDHIDAR